MATQIGHLPDEADIGSGEKTPGHIETEKMIEQVGKCGQHSGRAEDDSKQSDAAGKREPAAPKGI